MKTITCIRFSFIILFTSLFLSCIKEGPAGPAGSNGRDGLDGLNGKDGRDGNANVYSKIYTVDYSAWYISGTSILADIKTNWISNSVVDNGSVLVLMEDLNQINRWQMLPYTWPASGEYFGYWYESGWVTLEINNGTNTPPVVVSGDNYTFKIVAIDGYAAMTNEAKQHIIQQVMNNTELKL